MPKAGRSRIDSIGLTHWMASSRVMNPIGPSQIDFRASRAEANVEPVVTTSSRRRHPSNPFDQVESRVGSGIYRSFVLRMR